MTDASSLAASLAQRQRVKLGVADGQDKAAIDFSQIPESLRGLASNVGERLQGIDYSSPAATAALGAGAGGLAGLLTAHQNEPGSRSYLSNALRGAAAGGLLGYGANQAVRHWQAGPEQLPKARAPLTTPDAVAQIPDEIRSPRIDPGALASGTAELMSERPLTALAMGGFAAGSGNNFLRGNRWADRTSPRMMVENIRDYARQKTSPDITGGEAKAPPRSQNYRAFADALEAGQFKLQPLLDARDKFLSADETRRRAFGQGGFRNELASFINPSDPNKAILGGARQNLAQLISTAPVSAREQNLADGVFDRAQAKYREALDALRPKAKPEVEVPATIRRYGVNGPYDVLKPGEKDRIAATAKKVKPDPSVNQLNAVLNELRDNPRLLDEISSGGRSRFSPAFNLRRPTDAVSDSGLRTPSSYLAREKARPAGLFKRYAGTPLGLLLGAAAEPYAWDAAQWLASKGTPVQANEEQVQQILRDYYGDLTQ